MGSLIGTLFRTALLDDAAYRDWQERPNLFLRGIILIAIVSLITGLIPFAINLVNQVRPVDADAIRQQIDEAMEMQFRFNPTWQDMDPEARQMMEKMVDVMVPMITDIMEVRAPLPQGISGFFQAFGAWLSRTVRSLAGWLLYGAMVLVVVNLLGGSARLPNFLGMVALYAVPAVLGLLAQIPWIGCLFGLAALVWSIAVYVKATSVAGGLDIGKSILAVFAPFVVLLLLAVLLTILSGIWMAILF